MKKIWLLLSAMIMAIGLTACADKAEEKADKKETDKKVSEEATAPTEADLQKPLVKFYIEIERTINGVDRDLTDYEKAEEPTAEQKTKASESAAAVVTELNNVKAPEELKDQKADLEAALKDITDSYQAKADELKKDAPSLDAANETFNQGNEKLGKLFESLKLLKPDLAKSVN